MSVDTFIDYMRLFERMDIICTLQAFDQNTLRGFPKKARKIHFADPFIADVVGRWLERERYVSGLLDESIKVESTVASEIGRQYPVYYIKANGEVDLVVVHGRKFIPIEIKWTNQMCGAELKQIKQYHNAVILTKRRTSGIIKKIPTIFVPCFILNSSMKT